MAIRANIAVNDGQATPVSHTFAPTSGDGNVPGVSIIRYEDRSGGVKVGFPTVEVHTRVPTKTNKNHKVSFVIKNPILETLSNSTVTGIAPAPTVAYETVFRGEFVLPERASEQSRKDVLAYAKNLLANAIATDAVVTLDSPW